MRQTDLRQFNMQCKAKVKALTRRIRSTWAGSCMSKYNGAPVAQLASVWYL